MESWIQTATGQKYHPFAPRMARPDIKAIAHQLAQTNRYGGACKFPYSVAQHSVLLARAALRDGYNNEIAFAILMHDAAEPFGFCDLSAPVKYGKKRPLLGIIFVWLHQHFERKVHNAIMAQYNVKQDKFTWSIVKKYDRSIIADEYNHTIIRNTNDWGLPEPLNIKIKEMHWQEAKREFIKMYILLRGELYDG